MNVDVYIFLRFVVIFSEFFELSMYRFARIARYLSESPRPIRLSARRVGGRDRDCEPCTHPIMISISTNIPKFITPKLYNGSLTGKLTELVDAMVRRNVSILCV